MNPEQNQVPQVPQSPPPPVQSPVPPQSPPPTNQYNSPSPPPPQPTKSHAKVFVIIGLVLLGFLFIGGVLFALVFSQFNNVQQKARESEQAAINRSTELNSVTAKYISEFEIVCHSGSINNSATYSATAPKKIAAFYHNDALISERWMDVSYGTTDTTFRADRDNIEATNVVACLDEVSGSGVKSKQCEFNSRGKKLSIPYFAVQYSLTFREAKTGKEISKGEDINGPAVTCPAFATYNQNDPKLHATPDNRAVENALANFAR